MPDGQRILSGANDKTVRVWLLDGTHQNTFSELHTDTVNALVALPDNQHALSASNSTVKLFNVNDGAVLRTFKHHTGHGELPGAAARRPPLRQRLGRHTDHRKSSRTRSSRSTLLCSPPPRAHAPRTGARGPAPAPAPAQAERRQARPRRRRRQLGRYDAKLRADRRSLGADGATWASAATAGRRGHPQIEQQRAEVPDSLLGRSGSVDELRREEILDRRSCAALRTSPELSRTSPPASSMR